MTRKVFPPEISIRWQSILVGVLLLLYILQAISASTQKSNTFDEALHLTTGYLYWTHPDSQLWPDTGIFSQAWASLPLLADRAQVINVPPDALRNMGEWEQGYDFFYLMGNNPTRMLLQGRFMISLLGAVLGALVFFWSRQLFGTGAGFVSLILFIFCPTMLAHGALVTADMAGTLGFFAATLSFWNLSHTVSIRNLFLSVLALGCLVLAKMSSPLIGAIFLSLLIVRILSKRPTNVLFLTTRTYVNSWAKAGIGGILLLVHGVALITILWLVYNFKYFDWGEGAIRNEILNAPGLTLWSANGIKAFCIETLSEINLLPPAYLEGLSYQLLTPIKGGFLCGSYSDSGWLSFFPFAFLTKTPISTLLLLLLSFIAFWRRKFPPASVLSRGEAIRSHALYDLAPLLILGGVYGLACLSSGLNVGHRYLMPIYPVLFVLAGANIFWLRCSKPIVRIGLGILLVGAMIESLSVRSHYMAFFNQLVGGPRYGYHYLVDSSLDWGQDLPGLAQWLQKNVPAASDTKIYLSYFGTGDAEYYGIRSLRLPDQFNVGSPEPFPWAGGIYCISATRLQGPKWTASLEGVYQQVKIEKSRWDATSTDIGARESLLKEKGADYWNLCLVANWQLKFDRLCSYLRKREPDDEVGYSILIYRLSDEDLRQALEGSLMGGLTTARSLPVDARAQSSVLDLGPQSK